MDSKKQVILVALTIAASLAADSMLYIALPIYWHEIGLKSLWEVGILLSINRFIRLPINPLIGWIYSKIEIRAGLFIGVILAIMANLGYYFATNLWLWIFLRSTWGFAWAFFSIGGLLTVINCAEENNRGQLMGTYNGLYRLGSLVGMLLGGLLPGTIGFKNTTLVFGLVSIISLVLVLFIQKIGEGNSQSSKSIEIKDLLLKPVLVVLGTGFVINMIYRGVIPSTLSLLIHATFGPEIAIATFIISATALAGIVQSARWGWEPFLAARIGKWSDGLQGRVPFLLASLLLAAITLILITRSLSLIPWLGIVGLLLVCATSLTTLADALASDVAKANNPISIMTAYTVLNDLGAAVGPLLIYQIINLENGFSIGFSGNGLILIALAVAWYQITYRSPIKNLDV